MSSEPDDQVGDVAHVPPELADLKGTTTGADSDASSPPGAGAPPISLVSPDEAEAAEWAMVPATMGQIICRALPEVKDAWSRENALEWGRAMVPIARSNGWTVSKFMTWLGPWVGLAIASERMIVPTFSAGYKRIQAARAAAAKAAAPAAEPVKAAT